MSSISTSPAPSQNSPGLDEALEFIEAIHPNPSEACQIEIRFIDKDSGKSNSRFFVAVDQAIVEINNLFARHNVFIGIASRRGKRGRAEDLVDTNAICVDLDVGKNDPDKGYATVEEALRALAEFPLQPSIVVRSGSGVHAYWLLDKPFPLTSASDRSRYQAAAKGLAKVLRGDNTHDPARIMRTPGTLNFKGAPTLARLSEPHLDRRYPFSAFLPWSVSADPEPEPKAKRGGRGRQPERANQRHATTPGLPATDEESKIAARQALEFARNRGVGGQVLRKIVTGVPEGQRSDFDFAAMCALFEKGAESAILPIWRVYSVGAKYWEAGERYCERTRNSVQAHLESKGVLPFEEGYEPTEFDSKSVAGSVKTDAMPAAVEPAKMFLSSKRLHAGTYLPIQAWDTALAGGADIRSGRRLLIVTNAELGFGERFEGRNKDNCDCSRLASGLRRNGYRLEPWDTCQKFNDGDCSYGRQYHERYPVLSIPACLLHLKAFHDFSFVVLLDPPAGPPGLSWDISELQGSDGSWLAWFSALAEVASSFSGEVDGGPIYERLKGLVPLESIAKALPFTGGQSSEVAMQMIALECEPEKNVARLAASLQYDVREYLAGGRPWRLATRNYPGGGAPPRIVVRFHDELEGLRWLNQKEIMVLDDLMPVWGPKLARLGLSNFMDAPDVTTRRVMDAFERLESRGDPATLHALAREGGCCGVTAVSDRKDELALRLDAIWVGGRGPSGLRLVRRASQEWPTPPAPATQSKLNVW